MFRVFSSMTVCLFGFILWVIYLANTGSHNPLLALVQQMPYGDKIGHLCLFGSLNFVAILGLRFHRIRYRKLRIYTATAALAVFVLAEEITQLANPLRTFDWLDLSADALGMTLANLAAWGVQCRLTASASKTMPPETTPQEESIGHGP